jgi:hypothetical protein
MIRRLPLYLAVSFVALVSSAIFLACVLLIVSLFITHPLVTLVTK